MRRSTAARLSFAVTSLLSIAVGATLAVGLASARSSRATSPAHHAGGLTVSAGTVKSATATVTGSFTVRNSGSKATKASKAVIGLATPALATVLARFSVPALAPGGKQKFPFTAPVPESLPVGRLNVTACLGQKFKPATAHCRVLGVVVIASPVITPGKPVPTPTTTTPTTTAPTTTTPTTTTPTSTTPAPTPPASTVPTSPAAYQAEVPEFFADNVGQYNGAQGSQFTSGYWVVVPPSYDATNQTPETLVVWMHGLSGSAENDANELTDYHSSDRPFILISLSGPEGGNNSPNYWNTDDGDVSKVEADIAQVKTQFNIDPRRVIIGGYSSGGDLAYRTIWEHSTDFAGILASNTNPFRDTGLIQSTALGDASWKFNDMQVATETDGEYHLNACGYGGGEPACAPDGQNANIDQSPDIGVKPAIQAMDDAGFTPDLIVQPGDHYDDDSCQTESQQCTGTYNNINAFLMASVGSDGWESPAP